MKTMNTMKYLALILMAGFVLTGCDWHGNETVNGSGPVESMEVELPPFEGVNVTGTCNVDIQIG